MLIKVNFLSFFKTVLVYLILSVSIFFLLPTTGFFSLFPTTTNLNLNEPSLNLYYLLWTNILFLPLYFFSLLFLIIFFTTKGTWLQFFTYLTFLSYCSENLDLIYSNSCLSFNNNTSNRINNLLTNTLNKYHPPIFFVSTIFLPTSLSFLYYLNQNYTSSYVFSNLVKVRSILYLLLVVNALALLLGSWWALQEGTWGGWWNWDPSETLGFTFLLFAINFIHKKSSFMQVLQHLFKFYAYSLLIIGFYFFIQINFDISSHNFGVKHFFFFNNNLFLMNSIICICTYTLIISFNSKTFFKHKLLLINKGLLSVDVLKTISLTSIQLLQWIIYMTIFLSFYEMFISFFDNLLNLNFFKYNFKQQTLNNFSLILITFVLFRVDFKILQIPQLTMFMVQHPTNILPTNFNIKKSKLFFLHFLITSFFIINCLNFNTNLISFQFFQKFSNPPLVNTFLTQRKVTYTCDFFSFESVYLTKINKKFEWKFGWTAYTNENYTNISVFFLEFSNKLFFNALLTTSLTSLMYTYIELNATSNLFFVFFGIVGCLCFWKERH